MMYYLITNNVNDDKSIVEAESSTEAVTCWVKSVQKDWGNEGRRMKFNPVNFTVEAIGETIIEANRIR